MARSTKRKQMPVGKVGNSVIYSLKGQMVQRAIGKSNKPPTIGQLANRQRTYLSNNLLRPVKEFIDIGFNAITKGTTWNAHNAATSYNLLNAVTGAYPDQQIDYPKVLLSRGKMPKPINIAVRLNAAGLEFVWKVDTETKCLKLNDQVMLMAFFSAENDAVYEINGAKRIEGKAVLKLPQYEKPVIMETYISFISANHKRVSDSIYTGQFLWDCQSY